MKLTEIVLEGLGRVDSGGVKTDVNLMMIPHARVGDYVIIHAGFGIEVLDDQEAEIRLELFKELAKVQEQLGEL
jgi:hydrogenase expression/formation protein HypC